MRHRAAAHPLTVSPSKWLVSPSTTAQGWEAKRPPKTKIKNRHETRGQYCVTAGDVSRAQLEASPSHFQSGFLLTCLENQQKTAKDLGPSGSSCLWLQPGPDWLLCDQLQNQQWMKCLSLSEFMYGCHFFKYIFFKKLKFKQLHINFLVYFYIWN